jgi:hypothetical protein
MRLRKLIIATHRDVGYFFAGLTILYAISGVAVNHIEDWNPNYNIKRKSLQLPSLEGLDREQIQATVLAQLGITDEPLSSARMGPDDVRIFLERRTLFVTPSTGSVVDERISRKPLFFQANALHLNNAKGLWTWYADVYAVGLLLLAGTGIFIITGKKGLSGRGMWLLLAGLLVPLIYMVFVV